MKLEVTINTVNSASWMLCVGHGGFNVRTDKATFNLFTPDGYSRDEVLIQTGNFIRDFNLFTPDVDDNGIEVAEAVCRSFNEAADALLMEDITKPIDFYRSWIYDKYKTAVISIKEIV